MESHRQWFESNSASNTAISPSQSLLWTSTALEHRSCGIAAGDPRCGCPRAPWDVRRGRVGVSPLLWILASYPLRHLRHLSHPDGPGSVRGTPAPCQPGHRSFLFPTPVPFCPPTCALCGWWGGGAGEVQCPGVTGRRPDPAGTETQGRLHKCCLCSFSCSLVRGCGKGAGMGARERAGPPIP